MHGLTGDAWIESIRCMYCHQPSDGEAMMLCDSCNGGAHFYCGPAPFAQLPPAAAYYQCIYCARFGGAYHPSSNRPPPASSKDVQSGISSAILAGYANSTVSSDPGVFAHFRHWHEGTYGIPWLEHLDFLNADVCSRHRSEALAGYLRSLSTSDARMRDPKAVYQALRRSFRLYNMKTDAFGTGSVAHRVILGLLRLHPPRRHTAKIGVTDSMMALALADASVAESSHSALATRVHGLASIYSYCAGGRVSECAATPHSVPRNKHTLKVRMFVSPSPGTLEIHPSSTKTTDWRNGSAAKRPRIRVWCSDAAAGDDSTSESALVAFLVRALPSWFEVARLSGNDCAFSYVHLAHGRSYHPCVSRDSLASYTKSLAVRVGLPPEHFSTKSWKMGRVSHGVLRGISTPGLLARGNHLSESANEHYRPIAIVRSSALSSASSPGIPHQFAADEARRINRGHGICPAVRGPSLSSECVSRQLVPDAAV